MRNLTGEDVTGATLSSQQPRLAARVVPVSPIGVLEATCLSCRSDERTVESCTNSSQSSPDTNNNNNNSNKRRRKQWEREIKSHTLLFQHQSIKGSWHLRFFIVLVYSFFYFHFFTFLWFLIFNQSFLREEKNKEGSFEGGKINVIIEDDEIHSYSCSCSKGPIFLHKNKYIRK